MSERLDRVVSAFLSPEAYGWAMRHTSYSGWRGRVARAIVDLEQRMFKRAVESACEAFRKLGEAMEEATEKSREASREPR